MGGLKEHAPSDGKLQLPGGSTIADALAALQIDPARAQVVLHNGRPQANHGQDLSEQDELTVIPLVGGG